MTGPNTVHVTPRDDLIAHEMTGDCPCGPRTQHVPDPEGDGWVIIHNSLDGREAGET